MDNPLHYDLSIAGNTYTTDSGAVTTNQTLRRGGITQIANASPAAGGGPVFIGDFSGGRPTCDDQGHLTFPTTDPSAPANKRNYIRYIGDGRILMSPNFDWVHPDGSDGPSFLFTAFPHAATPSA